MTDPDPNHPNLDMDLPVVPTVAARARTLGEQLRVAREARGLHLADLAARTRIPERTLAAIEADAYEQLPHTTFAAGFIRSLAREVGMPEDEAMTRYRAENTRFPPVPTAPPLRAIEPERVPSRRLAWASAGVAAAAILGAVLWFSRDRSAPVTPVAQTTTAAPVASLTTIPSAPLAASAPTSATAPPAANSTATPPLPMLGTPGGAVTLTATQDVWLEIKDRTTGTRAMSGILAQGQVYAVPPGDMQLRTGRAGALQVRVNGRILPPLGGPVETVRNVDLAPQSLIARTAGTPADAATPPR